MPAAVHVKEIGIYNHYVMLPKTGSMIIIYELMHEHNSPKTIVSCISGLFNYIGSI